MLNSKFGWLVTVLLTTSALSAQPRISESSPDTSTRLENLNSEKNVNLPQVPAYLRKTREIISNVKIPSVGAIPAGIIPADVFILPANLVHVPIPATQLPAKPAVYKKPDGVLPALPVKTLKLLPDIKLPLNPLHDKTVLPVNPEEHEKLKIPVKNSGSLKLTQKNEMKPTKVKGPYLNYDDSDYDVVTVYPDPKLPEFLKRALRKSVHGKKTSEQEIPSIENNVKKMNGQASNVSTASSHVKKYSKKRIEDIEKVGKGESSNTMPDTNGLEPSNAEL